MTERITVELTFNGDGWKRKLVFAEENPDMTPEQFQEAYKKEVEEGRIDLAEEAMYCDSFKVLSVEVDYTESPDHPLPVTESETK